MSIKGFAVVSVLTLLTMVPVEAAPLCVGTNQGLQFEFGLEWGKLSVEERNRLDLMELRRRGVDASGVDRWNGCIRAYVRLPGGGSRMEFYDPDTYQQVF